MKSLNELKKIRIETAKKMNMYEQKNGFRVTVGLATCGIAAGAKVIYDAMKNEISNRELKNVSIALVGCMGECALEPIVEVYDPTGSRTTYCKVKANDVKKIIDQHINEGKIVKELLKENYKK